MLNHKLTYGCLLALAISTACSGKQRSFDGGGGTASQSGASTSEQGGEASAAAGGDVAVAGSAGAGGGSAGSIAAGGTAVIPNGGMAQGGADVTANGGDGGDEGDGGEPGAKCVEGCPIGTACEVDAQCLLPESGKCVDGACAMATCSDGVRNGAESAIDCGGSCGPCDVGEMCQAASDCDSGACVGGLCVECAPSSTRCADAGVQRCSSSGTWGATVNCAVGRPVCKAGACIAAPQSCQNLATNCGVNKNDSCCRGVAVPSGSWNYSNDAAQTKQTAAFVMDAYEVTAARMRAFVLAGQGVQASPPTPGSGAGPNLPDGWDAAWKANLTLTSADLAVALACDGNYQTWSNGAGPNDLKPINCVTWYEAFAFCAWDGGYIPSPAEWNYVAAGGSEQRALPWSNPSYSTFVDGSYASYADELGQCLGESAPACNLDDIIAVGSKPKGAGRWGHFDLGGNMFEWVSDRFVWGGNFNYPSSALRTNVAYGFPAEARSNGVGFRCARAL